METEIPGPIVRVEVIPQMNDYQIVQRLMRKRRWRWLTFALLLVSFIGSPLFIVIQIATYPAMGLRPLEGWIFFGSLFMLLLVHLAIDHLGPWADLQRWQTRTELHFPVTYLFSPSGVQITTATWSKTLGWQEVARVQRVGNCIALDTGLGLHVFSELAFFSPQERRTFQQLASALVRHYTLQ
jgi:hypothetical protein